MAMLNSREERRKFIKENRYKYPLTINFVETNNLCSTLSEWLQQLDEKYLDIYFDPINEEYRNKAYDLVLTTSLIFQKNGKTEFTDEDVHEGVNNLILKMRVEKFARDGLFESPDLNERWNVNEQFELKKTEEFAKIPQEELDKLFEEKMSYD